MDGLHCVVLCPAHGVRFMRLLILAGTAEARQIAAVARREPGVVATASLATQDMRPVPLGIPTRIGGFGGREQFRDYLIREGVDCVLDATHPFAVKMSHRAAEVCKELGIEHAQFIRRPWLPTPADTWTFLNEASEAAAHIPKGRAVFLATGRRDLEDFANLTGRRVYCRVKDQPDRPYPYPDGSYVVGSGPFTTASEERLFGGLGIDWLVVRNSGGHGSWPKLEAARNIGIRVAVIRRPLQPEAVRLETVAETTAWIRRRQ